VRVHQRRAGGRTIPILMLTALTGTEDKIKALECGADDFLNKPINKDELRTRIRSLIKIRNLRKELDSSENIIMTLGTRWRTRTPRSGGHVQRVAQYAARPGEKLGMSRDERETIVKGAMLHDVGMIGVPDALLAKRAADDDERARRRRAHAHGRVDPRADDDVPAVRADRALASRAPRRPRLSRWSRRRRDPARGADRRHRQPLRRDLMHETGGAEGDALARLRNEAEDGAFEPELTALFAAPSTRKRRGHGLAAHPARSSRQRARALRRRQSA
jgi:CheY-like chemotaxis protein